MGNIRTDSTLLMTRKPMIRTPTTLTSWEVKSLQVRAQWLLRNPNHPKWGMVAMNRQSF